MFKGGLGTLFFQYEKGSQATFEISELSLMGGSFPTAKFPLGFKSSLRLQSIGLRAWAPFLTSALFFVFV